MKQKSFALIMRYKILQLIKNTIQTENRSKPTGFATLKINDIITANEVLQNNVKKKH